MFMQEDLHIANLPSDIIRKIMILQNELIDDMRLVSNTINMD